MNGKTQSLIEKIKTLPDEQVVEVENFVDLIAARAQDRALVRAAMAASEAAFAVAWDNPADDIYNDA